MNDCLNGNIVHETHMAWLITFFHRVVYGFSLICPNNTFTQTHSCITTLFTRNLLRRGEVPQMT